MMEKKVALLADGTTVLAEAIALSLERQGFRLLAGYAGRGQPPPAWIERQRKNGLELSSVAIDPGNYPSCTAAVRSIFTNEGRIDVLINNADTACGASLAGLSFDAWRETIKANADAAFNLAKQVVDGMSECGWGRIVNVSSVYSRQSAGGDVAYAAARSAVHGFTKALALETARKGVTVNTVSLGRIAGEAVNTPAHDVPVGREGTVTEVAALIAYLCSDDAAFLTGVDIAVDGGQHMH